MLVSEQLDHAPLRQHLEVYGLQHAADAILVLARPCLRMTSVRLEDDDLPVGASKIGGSPDVPPSFVWPLWQDAPLRFLGQLNLALCAHPALPLRAQGLLSFFFDGTGEGTGPDHTGAGRVFHFPLSHLARSRGAAPAFRPCQLAFHMRLSLPDLSGLSTFASAVDLTDEERSAYSDFYSLRADYLELVGRHQLYGYPEFSQRDPYEELHLAYTGMSDETFFEICRSDKVQADTFRREAQRWALLMQFGEDDQAEMSGIDSGKLSYCYPPGQPARQAFDELWTLVSFD